MYDLFVESNTPIPPMLAGGEQQKMEKSQLEKKKTRLPPADLDVRAQKVMKFDGYGKVSHRRLKRYSNENSQEKKEEVKKDALYDKSVQTI
jgi:hypothetical protein